VSAKRQHRLSVDERRRWTIVGDLKCTRWDEADEADRLGRSASTSEFFVPSAFTTLLRARMQSASSETESKSLDLSICAHHYSLKAPCPKGQELPGTCVQHPVLQSGSALGDASTPGTPAGSMAGPRPGASTATLPWWGGRAAGKWVPSPLPQRRRPVRFGSAGKLLHDPSVFIVSSRRRCAPGIDGRLGTLGAPHPPPPRVRLLCFWPPPPASLVAFCPHCQASMRLPPWSSGRRPEADGRHPWRFPPPFSPS